MSREKHEMDEWLKRKLNQREFTFKDHYWEQAQQMLDEARPRRRRYFFWVLLACSVTLGAVVFTYRHVGEERGPVVENTSTTAASIKRVEPAVSQADAGQQSDEFVTEKTAHLSTQKEGPEHVIQQLSLSNTQHPNRILPSQQTSLINVNQAKSVQSSKEDVVSRHQEVSTSLVELTASEDEARTLPQKGDSNNEEINRLVVSFNLTSMLPLTSAPELTKVEAQPLPLLKYPTLFTMQSGLFLEAGITAFNVKSPEINVLGGSAGISYHKVLGKRTSVSVGLAYTQTHQAGGKRYYASGSYGFGEPDQRVGLNTVRLDYAGIGTQLHYYFKERNSIFTGASCMYVVNSKELLQKPGDNGFNRTTNGYYQVFNRVDYWLNVGYAYRITPAFSAGATVYQGIKTLSARDILTERKNFGLKLSLTYRLF